MGEVKQKGKAPISFHRYNGYIATTDIMYNYHAFGLDIQSVLALPELVPISDAAPEVRITQGQVEGTFAEHRSEQQNPYYQVAPSRVILHWPEVGAFEVKAGNQVVMDIGDSVDEELLRLPLLGPVMAAILMQRRRLVLHASAVAVGKGAVGFVGVKGSGKSTTSAALHRLGCPLVTDDLLAVRFEGDDAVVDPGFPRFKLWPEAVEAALHDDPASLPPLYGRVAKRRRMAGEAFSVAPLPLRALYVLAIGDDLETESITGRKALFELTPHLYNGDLVDAIDEASLRRWHFASCAKLVKHVPVRVLHRPADLDRLSEIAQRVADEVHHPPPAAR